MSILSNYEDERKQALGLIAHSSALQKQRDDVHYQNKLADRNRRKAGLATTIGTGASLYSAGALASNPVGWATLGIMALGSLF